MQTLLIIVLTSTALISFGTLLVQTYPDIFRAKPRFRSIEDNKRKLAQNEHRSRLEYIQSLAQEMRKIGLSSADTFGRGL